jgi:DNA-binding transcriptional ArsR family regulator
MTRRWGDELFLAIAHPARRAILDALLERDEVGASDLATRIGASPSSLSQHLAVLKSVALVDDRKDGRHVYYRLTPEPLLEVIAWMQTFESKWRSRLDALARYLDGPAGRSPSSAPTHASAPGTVEKATRTPRRKA